MKLFDIIEDFLDGAKIRRKSWNHSLWIEYYKPTSMTRLYILENEGLRLVTVDEEFSINDVIADDWEYYFEP